MSDERARGFLLDDIELQGAAVDAVAVTILGNERNHGTCAARGKVRVLGRRVGDAVVLGIDMVQCTRNDFDFTGVGRYAR